MFNWVWFTIQRFLTSPRWKPWKHRNRHGAGERTENSTSRSLGSRRKIVSHWTGIWDLKICPKWYISSNKAMPVPARPQCPVLLLSVDLWWIFHFKQPQLYFYILSFRSHLISTWVCHILRKEVYFWRKIT